MNIRQRLHQFAEIEDSQLRMGFATASDLEDWLVEELGDPEVLDGPVQTRTGWKRAVPPESIYHICSGNLSIAAETSLLISLILGSEAWFKLPSSGLPELEQKILRLPKFMSQRIHLIVEHDVELMSRCQVVVAFGSDSTIQSLRASIQPGQIFLPYGHRISLGVVTQDGATPAWAERAARETLLYHQLGCLSPQSYLCPDSTTSAAFSELLAAALDQQAPEGRSLPFEAQALIFEARQRATLAGDLVIHPKAPGAWTLVERQKSCVQPGPGFGFIEVVTSANHAETLQPWKGWISSVGYTSDTLSSADWAMWEKLGVHRLCRCGDLQHPPIAWPHDGRPRLADMIRWTYADPTLEIQF
ncbi:MAG: acyl-CoA reductase [Candidatus Methylacidiphilales bacterium]